MLVLEKPHAINPAELRLSAITSSLRACELFAGLSPGDLRNIAEISVCKSLETGEYLFREGDVSRGFYVVQRGAINIHRVSAVGKEQTIYIFRAGESFAEASLAIDAGYPADARAVEHTQVLLIQKAGFVCLLKKQPELALRMLAAMSLHLRALVAQIQDLTMRDVETRLANWLVKRCPDPKSHHPHTVCLTTTKRVLAAELSTCSETFSRTLAKFRDLGMITVNGKAITVCSPYKLTELLRRNLGE